MTTIAIIILYPWASMQQCCDIADTSLNPYNSEGDPFGNIYLISLCHD